MNYPDFAQVLFDHTFIECQSCGNLLDLSDGDHTYRKPITGRHALIVGDCCMPKECQRCGAEVERLVTVNDDDPSVGYYSDIEVCADCAERRRR